LRELVEPGEIATHGEFSVREALEPLLTVSSAGGWPVSWSIPEALRARGRAADVAQIVHSLLTNARRYAPGSPIEVTATTDDDFVVLRVDDRGPGVARGRRELIFERGERSDREHPDAKGLGLHIARRLARELDGELWVEPRQDSGARFVLIVPTASVHVRLDHLEHPRRAS
jgi:two-component system, OmpR family, sensor kinase